MPEDIDDYQRMIQQTADAQTADYLELIQKLQTGDMTPTSRMGLRPSEYIAKGAVTPYSPGMDPVQWLGANYNTPSHGSDFLSNVPIMLAAGGLTAGATGLLDPFSLESGAASDALGGATAPTATLPTAGTTLNAVDPLSLSTDELIAQAYADTPYAANAGLTSGGGIGTGAVAGTPLSRLTGINPDILSVAGTLGATGLGAYAANRQSNALENIAAQGRADRAPFLNAATGYLNNPQSYFEGPGKGALDATLAQLSAKFGNPIGSGAALQIATGAGLQDWRNAVTGFGNLGLAGEDTRAQLMSGAAQQDANVLSNIAGGASDLINPRRSLADLLKEYQGVRGLI